MCELFDTKLNVADKPMSALELADALRVADVLVPTVTDRIDSGLVGQAGDNLRLIANFGNGVDNIDVTSALRRGITVTQGWGMDDDHTYSSDLQRLLGASSCRASNFQVISAGVNAYSNGLVLERMKEVVQSDFQHTEFTNLEDENRSSIQVRLARPVSKTISVEMRGAIWRGIGDSMSNAFSRELLYAGLIYTN